MKEMLCREPVFYLNLKSHDLNIIFGNMLNVKDFWIYHIFVS